MIGKQAFFVLAVALCARQVSAAPLDKPACDALSSEIQSLRVLNVDKLMSKGPEWAVANLSTDDLNHIRRYIELDEQIKFRCLPATALIALKKVEGDDEDGAPPPAAEKGDDEADDNADAKDKSKAAEDTDKAGVKPAAKPAAPKKAAAAKKPVAPAPAKQVKPKDAAKPPQQATLQPKQPANSPPPPTQ